MREIERAWYKEREIKGDSDRERVNDRESGMMRVLQYRSRVCTKK